MNEKDFQALLAQYDYAFPESAVALEPSSPRDAAKLLAYDPAKDAFTHATFRDLPALLPPHSVLVLNQTKVLPARIEATKATGGKVRVLYVGEPGGRAARGMFHALADRPLKVGETLSVGRDRIRVEAREASGYLFLVVHAARVVPQPLDIFLRHGKTPIPPYLKRTPLGEKALRQKYQTVFARTPGSVAAPTASLHFTRRLIAALRKAGHDIAFVTLHVNMGTFAPLTAAALAEGKLHEEPYVIDARTVALLERAKKQGRPIIPVGTTALRTLEAAADVKGRLAHPTGATRIFIRPGYKFGFADGLITNFHVPKSSLMMLVASLTGRERLLSLYREAVARGYKLFSFGDGMLVLPCAGDVRRPRPIEARRRRIR